MASRTATRIASLFDRCKLERRVNNTVNLDLHQDSRKAFMAYLTAGDPMPDHTASLVIALERGGADLIELGVPFSDPIADGPVIQKASDRALRSGTTVAGIVDIVREIRRQSEIPLLLFSYMNPLLRYGFEKLARDACAAGIDGVLITDLPIEEAREPVEKIRAHGLDTVFLAAPTSTDERLRLVAAHSSGFIYAVSRTGVTGEQNSLADSAVRLTQRIRELTTLPVALGFGVSTPEHVIAASRIADAVVVGSAIVKFIDNCVEEHTPPAEVCAKLESFTRHLTAPLHHE